MWLMALFHAWLVGLLHRDERGQGTVEYVLLILGVVLFLIVSAYALQGVLSGAVATISTWIAGQNAP